ncbi:uncharacterized protein LOC129224067 [Uloborus diversus]|uniref:uncharacterized protein LOC129220324 n=1 Tax=Uloborus diversus TaxID=327109 RepID=UPI0024099CEE|nr:uncharacterized protein LOC129220324 [Uloborus diversus]XP_054714442.1 uncharacterized protein LOC129224067 [Uloborus diversus]
MNLALVAILIFVSMAVKAKVLNKSDDLILRKGVVQSEKSEMHFIRNNSYSLNEGKKFYESMNTIRANKKAMPQLLRKFSNMSSLNTVGRNSITHAPKTQGTRELLSQLLLKQNIKKELEHAQQDIINNRMLHGQEWVRHAKKFSDTLQIKALQKEVPENGTIKGFSADILTASNISTGIRTNNCTQNPVRTYGMEIFQGRKSIPSPKTTNFVSRILSQEDLQKNNQKTEHDKGDILPMLKDSSNSISEEDSAQYFTSGTQKDRYLELLTLNHATDVTQNNVNEAGNLMDAFPDSKHTITGKEINTLQYLMYHKGSLTSLEETTKNVLNEMNPTKTVGTALYAAGSNGKVMQHYEETKNSAMVGKNNLSRDGTIGKLVVQYDEESFSSSLNSVTDIFLTPKSEIKTKGLSSKNKFTDQPVTTHFFDDGFSCHKQKRSVFGSEESLLCPPCEQIHCYRQKKRRLQCRGGYTLDICGCCRVCAKLEGEKCGGQHDYLGKCDRDLFCEPQPPAVVSFFREGIKRVYKVHRGICKKFATKLETDISWTKSNCKPKCEPEFCMKNPRAICSAINAAEMTRRCQGSCQHTSCRACRFAQPDIRCPKCLANDFRCIRQFGRCIRKDSCKPKSYPCGNQLPVKHDGEVFLCKIPECDVNN